MDSATCKLEEVRPPVGGTSESMNKESQTKNPGNLIFRMLGPGLVTGAADDDPSGIVISASPY